MSRLVTYSSLKGNRPEQSLGGESPQSGVSQPEQNSQPTSQSTSRAANSAKTQSTNTASSAAQRPAPKPQPPKKGNKKNDTSSQKSEGYDKHKLRRQLPFIRERMEFGEWIFRNRYGVSTTVLCFLVAMFAFATLRFDITMMSHVDGFFVDLPEEKIEKREEPKKPEPKEPKPMEQPSMDDLKNVAVNEDAKLDGGLEDDKGTQASDIYKEAQAMQQRLAASRQAHEQAQAEDEAYLNDMRRSLSAKGKNKTKREQSKVSGNVTISWKLEGREATYIHNPAYRCPGAGTVTITIEVNRNGRVIDASVSSISRSNDNCLIDMAIEAARKTTFNVSGSAPEKQVGSITYIFVAQ